jgi:hypothetical protein
VTHVAYSLKRAAELRVACDAAREACQPSFKLKFKDAREPVEYDTGYAAHLLTELESIDWSTPEFPENREGKEP